MYRKYHNIIENFLIIEGHSKDYFLESRINVDFNKFLAEVLLSNKEPNLHLFIRNSYENPSSIFVQVNDNPIKEFIPGYWTIIEIKDVPSLIVKIESDGETYIKNFNLSDRLNFSNNGFINFKQ